MKKLVLIIILFTLSLCADTINLTKAEKDYLKNKEHLSVMNVDKFYPFTFVENGKATGYTVDVMKLMGQQINKEIKFITNPWNVQLKNLQNGSLDIMPYIVRTKKRESFVEFTDFTHITFLIGFAVHKTDEISTIYDLFDKKVAIVKSSFMYDHIKKNFPQIKLLGTKSVQESLELVVQKKAYTTLDNINTLNYLIKKGWLTQLKITTIDDLGLPLTNQLHMGVQKGNNELKSILEKAHKNLPSEEMKKLKDKWFEHKNEQFNLTPEEQAFLDKKPYLTTMSLARFHPFAFIKDNEHLGYSNDLLRLFSKILNKDLKYVTKPWNEQLEMLKDGSLDFIPYLAMNEERLEYMDFTNFEYFSYLNGLTINKKSNIKSAKDLDGKTIAVVNKYWYHDHLKKNFPNIKLLLTNSTEASVEAVAHNKADAALDNITSMNYYIKDSWLHNLKITSIDDLNLPIKSRLYMSVKKGNRLLKSILEKTYNAIPDKTIAELKKKWFKDTSDTNPLKLTKEEIEYLKNKPYISSLVLENFHPFSFIKNDKFYGYSVDTMRTIGEILNKEIKFIDKPWKVQLDMLKEGTLDVIPHLAINEERKAFADYTDFPHLTFLIGFAINKNSDISSMSDFKGKKIAVVNKYYLHDYLKKAFPSIELLAVSSTQEAVDAVAKDKAFAVIDNIPTLNYFIQDKWLTNLKIDSVNDLGLPLETKIPMGVTKGNVLLKSILEKANESISHMNKVNLKEKWMNLKTANLSKNNLSENEISYLKKKKKILMCVLPDWLPFEQIDKTGNHKGIGADFMKIVSTYIDTPIELLPTKEWSKSLQNIRERKCDILPVAMNIPSRRAHMDFTKPYVAEPFVVATKQDEFFIKDASELSFKKVGIVKSYAFIEVLQNKNPDIIIVDVKNTKEGLTKVQNGELYGYIDTMPTIGYGIQKYSMYDLKIAGRLEFDIELSVASRNDEPLLHTIMQKAIDTISEEQKRTIIGKWIEIKVSQELNYTLLWQVMFICLVIILVVLYKNREVRNLNKKLMLSNKETLEQNLMIDKYVLVLTTNTEGYITDVNHAYCKIIGYTKEELLGKSSRILKHPEMKSSVFKDMWTTISANHVWSGEVENLTKQKNDVYFYMHIEPLFKNNIKVGYKSICEDITDKKRVEKLSITDQLTKLYNRLKIDEVFQLEISRAKRYNHSLSIILLDIDYFKLVNDEYGHNVGDETLISIAQILKNSIRDTDTVGRWGGEEFMILASETSIENAVLLADKIRKDIEQYEFNTIGHKTSSFGVSTYHVGDTQEMLVKKADDALYMAKNKGRNRVEYVK